MSRIKRVEVQEFAFELPDLGFDAGGFNPKCGNAMPPVYADGYSDELGDVGADGCFPVPDGPGLGVVYDWEFIRKHCVASHEFK